MTDATDRGPSQDAPDAGEDAAAAAGPGAGRRPEADAQEEAATALSEASSSAKPVPAGPEGERRSARDRPLTIVGIGASAGGLEALERFFNSAPAEPGMAFVVVQHLSPDFKSLMGELLGKHTRMRVETVKDGDVVEPNRVYLNPPRSVLTLGADGRLHLRPNPEGPGPHFPIDDFLQSLAVAAGEDSVGIILSGTGSDGMRGMRAVKEAGGMIMVQEPSSARFDGMPRSAMSTGLVDHVVPPDAMAERLLRYVDRVPVPPPEPSADREVEVEVGRILEVLQEQQNIDFSGYKESTVLRRIDRRMAAVQAETLGEYRELLAGSPREMATLRKELLIGVTKFFRDTQTFEYLSDQIIPRVIENGNPKEPVRAWVAGCATGEEAYSYAMLFADYIERAQRSFDVQIFATDVDRDAIDFGSIGAYPESIAADVPPEMLDKYFERRSDTYLVKSRIRQMVVFATQNLIQDPPFTRMDLISCRNLLIYLRPELQQKVLSLFAFGLRPGGHLVLGSSESVGEMSDRFETVDSKTKVYRSRGNRRASLPGGIQLPHRQPEQLAARDLSRRRRPSRTDDEVAVQDSTEILLQSFVPTCVLVDEERQLIHVFNDASNLVKLPTGSSSLDILKLVERRLGTVLGSLLQRAFGGGPPELVYPDAGTHPDTGGRLDVRVRLLPTDHSTGRRFALVFFESSARDTALTGAPPRRSAAQETDAEQQLGAMEQELKSTRENLQATIEELETSNEELQATNEELLASNEELQSTNEELQSVNEELYTVNAEYQKKIDELTELTTDMDNLLRSSNIGTVFLDSQLCVRKFTPTAGEYVNLITADIGRPMHHISTRLQGTQLHRALEQILGAPRNIEFEARVEGTDHWVLVRLNPYRDASDQQRGVVVTFVDITELKGAQGMQQSILDSLLEHVAVIDGDGVIVHVNEAWRSFAEENGAPPGASSFDGSNYLEICRAAADDGDQDAALVAERLDALLSGRIPHFSLEYPCHAPDEDRWFLMYASRIRERDGGAVVSHIDITARKRAEDSGRAAQSGDAGNGEGPGGRGADQPDGPEGR